MKAIAVVDRNLAIGRDGQLLFHLPSDLAHFKAETLGGVVIMGRKTLESMPGGKPLPGRHTLVLSRSMEPGLWIREKKGKKWLFGVFADAQALLDFLDLKENDGRTIAVCGGAQIYRQMLPYCDTVHVTKVDYAYEADTWFPNLDEDPEWNVTAESEEQTYFDLEYRFVRYERV